MIIALYPVLLICICIAIWFVASRRRPNEETPALQSIRKAIAISIPLSPGLIVGHGVFPVPAIWGVASGVLTPDTKTLSINLTSIAITFLISFIIIHVLYWKKYSANGNTEQNNKALDWTARSVFNSMKYNFKQDAWLILIFIVLITMIVILN